MQREKTEFKRLAAVQFSESIVQNRKFEVWFFFLIRSGDRKSLGMRSNARKTAGVFQDAHIHGKQLLLFGGRVQNGSKVTERQGESASRYSCIRKLSVEPTS